MRLMIIATLLLAPLPGPLLAEQAPQAVPDAQGKPGETLTERLDRTDGVIKPPPVDAPMQIDPPQQDSNMPVIKPPAPAQDGQAPQGRDGAR
jgi:hypothetical protein